MKIALPKGSFWAISNSQLRNVPRAGQSGTKATAGFSFKLLRLKVLSQSVGR